MTDIPVSWFQPNIDLSLPKLTRKTLAVVVSGCWKNAKPQITGESLDNVKYRFDRIYFHWGPTDTEGSEHTLDYERFALELHVIYLKEGYNTPMEVHYDQCPKGILIIAYLFEVGYHDSNAMTFWALVLVVFFESISIWALKVVALNYSCPIMYVIFVISTRI